MESEDQMKKFKRVLIANRGEIAIRIIRACSELGIRSVAIYTEEDKNSLFRTKADESYLIGKNKGPIEAYLDINSIINLAIKKGVDAIHPGYGFLSENPEFVKKCEEAGIVFIGPSAKMMHQLGDKIQSKIVANSVKVPTIPGIEKPILSDEDAVAYADHCGYPVIVKAAAGGGGRGMRIVRKKENLIQEYRNAKSEALKAFGVGDIFIEKYIEKPKHIEVQVLGDNYGNLVHLYERDCSIQRRHQKIIEFTPSITLSNDKREEICKDALKIASAVNYRNAGTVEFLVDQEGNHYFIEMNPRIQVEHTVTEMVTGIDIVQSQILIAEGYELSSDAVGIENQESIQTRGYSIQCRITTEDPSNDFAPDTGKITIYRSGSGFGVRLDGGNAYTGSIISPYYDSLLVKCTSLGRTFDDAIKKSIRAIKEMEIKGVKTNTDFLINVLNHPDFKKGICDTNFIKNNKTLFDIEPTVDFEANILKYIADKVVNETGGIKTEFDVPKIPVIDQSKTLSGTRDILLEKGPEGLVQWIKDQKKLLLTDTTMRDAHQSLIATRVRTKDMVKIAEPTAHLAKDLFSMEMWGGATFDVSLRFLKECPWDRIKQLREKAPNVLFQMLLRGSNGVGYKNYPDNVIRKLIQEAADSGIDVFRIFDSLNWLEGMEVAIDEVRKQNKIAEVCMCYTGDILDKSKTKYTLEYYLDLAKSIEKAGAHILAIKDMSALLKPYAAFQLITELKKVVDIPIHLHTHDTSGNGVATILLAAEAGVDIADTAFNAMSGLTAQPALNSVVAALKNTDRDTLMDTKEIQKISDYWAAVRPVYEQFESDLKSSSAEIYEYEIPGGQYSNLKPQVESFGLGYRFNEVKEMFKEVNMMFGDIVKVTPSSKAVGDMAIFMVQNDLTPENIYTEGKSLSYPDTVVNYFRGMMGQPMGGFPKKLQKLVLKDEKPITCRPGMLLSPENFDDLRKDLTDQFEMEFTEKDLVSYALYPKVFKEYVKYIIEHGDLSNLGSDVYFHGLREGETCEISVEGHVMLVKLLEIGKLTTEGNRRIIFEVDGNRREVTIHDQVSDQRIGAVVEVLKADKSNPYDIGASIPGKVIEVMVSVGDIVEEGQRLAVLEAMKMETDILSDMRGKIESIFVSVDDQVESNQLLIKLHEA